LNSLYIPVSQAALASVGEPHKLYHEIKNFYDFLVRYEFEQERFPTSFIAAAQFLTYVGEVQNGGHSQFVGNLFPNSGLFLQCISKFCGRNGLREIADITTKAGEWVINYPAAAAKQTGFEGGLNDFLSELDSRFFGLDLAAISGKFDDIVRQKLDLRPYDGSGAEERVAARNAWLSWDEEPKWVIARKVYPELRKLFSDPMNVGLALASSQIGTTCAFHTFTDHPNHAPDIRPHSFFGNTHLRVIDLKTKEGKMVKVQLDGGDVVIESNYNESDQINARVKGAQIDEVTSFLKKAAVAEAASVMWWVSSSEFRQNILMCRVKRTMFGKLKQVRWNDSNWAIIGGSVRTGLVKYDGSVSAVSTARAMELARHARIA